MYAISPTYNHSYILGGGGTIILPLVSQGVVEKGSLSNLMSLMIMQGDGTYHINQHSCVTVTSWRTQRKPK